MKQLVEYGREDGNSILIDIDLPEAGFERAGRGDQVIRAKEHFAAAIEHVKPVARTIISTFSGLAADEIGVDFGIKLSAKAGAIIASADTEANFTMRLTWKRKNKPSLTPSPNAPHPDE